VHVDKLTHEDEENKWQRFENAQLEFVSFYERWFQNSVAIHGIWLLSYQCWRESGVYEAVLDEHEFVKWTK